MLSPCCGVNCYEAFGDTVCSACFAVIASPPRPAVKTTQKCDLLAWLFPAEPGEPPRRTEVFVRTGRRVRKVDRLRGKPDGWFWIDA